MTSSTVKFASTFTIAGYDLKNIATSVIIPDRIMYFRSALLWPRFIVVENKLNDKRYIPFDILGELFKNTAIYNDLVRYFYDKLSNKSSNYIMDVKFMNILYCNMTKHHNGSFEDDNMFVSTLICSSTSDDKTMSLIDLDELITILKFHISTTDKKLSENITDFVELVESRGYELKHPESEMTPLKEPTMKTILDDQCKGLIAAFLEARLIIAIDSVAEQYIRTQKLVEAITISKLSVDDQDSIFNVMNEYVFDTLWANTVNCGELFTVHGKLDISKINNYPFIQLFDIENSHEFMSNNKTDRDSTVYIFKLRGTAKHPQLFVKHDFLNTMEINGLFSADDFDVYLSYVLIQYSVRNARHPDMPGIK